jgi:hypothetical protein
MSNYTLDDNGCFQFGHINSVQLISFIDNDSIATNPVGVVLCRAEMPCTKKEAKQC